VHRESRISVMCCINRSKFSAGKKKNKMNDMFDGIFRMPPLGIQNLWRAWAKRSSPNPLVPLEALEKRPTRIRSSSSGSDSVASSGQFHFAPVE
jgi:hypothetical protein